MFAVFDMSAKPEENPRSKNGRSAMSTHICIDCDSAGDGNCAVCHGSGRIAGESYATAPSGFGNETSCSSCGGSGQCQKCDGSGEIEVGGEG